MAAASDDVDKRPQRRRPLIAGTGWLLFVCIFLPTLRVCSDPVAPIEFPFCYAVYLGAAVMGVMAVIRSLRAQRGWFTLWYVLWFATAIAWLALILADAGPIAAVFVLVFGIAGLVWSAVAFHRQKLTPKAFWIGGIVHGSISLIWYLLLSTDQGAVWGAAVGLSCSIGFLIASVISLVQHNTDLALEREPLPMPLPTARVIER